MILSLFRKDPRQEAAEALYATALERAREPGFYIAYKVADTVEGRFELVALHVFLLIRRLKSEGEGARRVSQALLDVFFSDMDGVLRELGVGDLSVGKKIRGLAEAFMGRTRAYDAALAEDGHAALAAALSRNVYAQSEISPAAHALAGYVKASAQALAVQPAPRLAKGIASFADLRPPPDPASEE